MGELKYITLDELYTSCDCIDPLIVESMRGPQSHLGCLTVRRTTKGLEVLNGRIRYNAFKVLEWTGPIAVNIVEMSDNQMKEWMLMRSHEFHNCPNVIYELD